MARAAAHRALAGVHYEVRRSAGFAYLSAERQLPVRGALSIVADARLDNRDDLVPSLRTQGITPTSSDAEVILAAYERWGTDCAVHLIGDFAFAVWDEAEQRLFAARDPLAMRPFYYHPDPKHFLFASEIGQLLAAGVPKRVNETMAALYLNGPFDPGEATFFADVRQLPPAHALLTNASGVRVWRYWEPDPERRIRFRDERDYAAGFRELFLRAVQDRLRGHEGGAGAAIALSGGVDSGSVAAAAGWLGHRSLRAYTWAYADPQLAGGDEREVARLVAEPYGIPLTPIFGDDTFPLSHPEHGPNLGTPFVWPTQALLDRVQERSRQDGARTLLTGDRGDETVGDWVYDYPGWLRAGHVGAVLRDLKRHHRASGERYASLVKRLFVRPLLGNRRQRTLSAPWVSDALSRRVNLPERLDALHPAEPAKPNQARRARIFGPAAQQIVSFGGERAARYGLELACPWSDRRVAEYVLAIPQWQVQRLSEPKRLPKEALVGILPDAARGKIGKIGANEAHDRFGKIKKARSLVTFSALVADSVGVAWGFLEPNALRAAYEDYRDDRGSEHNLWWPLTLELWLRQHWT